MVRDAYRTGGSQPSGAGFSWCVPCRHSLHSRSRQYTPDKELYDIFECEDSAGWHVRFEHFLPADLRPV
jgi:hypothetical protein